MDRYGAESSSSRTHRSLQESSPRDRRERSPRPDRRYRENAAGDRSEGQDSDSSDRSESHSKRHRGEKSHSSKKKSKSKHKKKSSHKEHKHKKEKKLYYESGEEVKDLLEEAPKDVENKKPKLQREGWMTMDGLDLDAFVADNSTRRARAGQEIDGEREVAKNRPEIFSPGSNYPEAKGTVVNISSVSSLKTEEPVSIDSLNLLQARIIKAQLMGSSNLAELEAEYKSALTNQKAAQKKNNAAVPSFDARGKYVDIGSSRQAANEKDTGSSLDQDIQSMIQQEKYSTSKDHYDQLARNISKDARYEDNEEYLDERSVQLAAHKHRSEYQKRLIAANDYKKTKRALENCIFCSQDDNTPAAPIVSMGHHAYLALPSNSELVPGHCLIVPGEHLLTSLDAEDPTWLEIRNFMKCLMQMFAEQDRGVVFIETVLNLNNCYHTVIECIPLPWDDADDAPGYFKEGLLEADEEWSHHSKVIDTKERTFRRSMTSQLPYFHVWFHPDGGYGHIIEDPAKFPRFFGHEIIAGILNIDPLVWRRPTKYPLSQGGSRVEEFKAKNAWDKFDWTKMLD